MDKKRRKNKTIADREKEIIKDFFKTLSIQKKPSGNGWFFSWRKTDEDVKGELERAREKLKSLYGYSGRWGEWEKKTGQSDKFTATFSAEKINDIEGMEILDKGSKLEPLSQIAKVSKYKREYLGYLVRQGKLKARKINGAWMTTKEWVDEFTSVAEARKKDLREELSHKLGSDSSDPKPAYNQSPGPGRLMQWEWKTAVVLMAIVFLVAAANVTKADWETLRDEAIKNILASYNLTVSKIDGTAEESRITGWAGNWKIGTDKIAQIGQDILDRKKVQKFERESRITLSGKEEDVAKIAKDFSQGSTFPSADESTDSSRSNLPGLVAGDESNQGSTFPSALSADSSRSNLSGDDILTLLDHNLTHENIAEHSVRRWNLNKDSVNSNKIQNYSILGRDLATNSVNSRTIDDGSIKSQDLERNIEITGTFTVNGAAYFEQSVSLTGDIDAPAGTIGTLNGTNLTYQTANLKTIDLGTNTITDQNFTGNWDFNTGNLTGISSLTANTGTITTLGGTTATFATGNFTTANLGTADLGTNTITDQNLTGDWSFNAGNLTHLGTVSSGAVTTNGSIKPDTDISFDLGDGTHRWNNLYAANIHTSGISTSGQAVFNYEPLNTNFSESSVLINPTSAIANVPLLGIGVGGVESLRVDEGGNLTTSGNLTVNGASLNYFAGNVGIGTTTPGAKLEVAGNILARGNILPEMTGASGNVSVRTIGDTSNRFSDVWAEEMHLGASSLYVNGKLVITDVSQTMNFTTDLDQSLAVKTSGTGNLSLQSDSGTMYFNANNQINANGKGGIEITVPADNPSKNLNLTNASLNGNITFTATGSNSQILGNAVQKVSFTSPVIELEGNVGIGTAAPGAYKLYVNGDAYVNGTLTATTFSGSGTSLTSLPAGQLSGTIPSAILGNSTMYIGTTAHALNRASASESLTGITGLTPNANFTLTQNSVAAFASVEAGAIANTLYLIGGNVGIGTTTPGAKLEIANSGVYGLLVNGAYAAFKDTTMRNMYGASGHLWDVTYGDTTAFNYYNSSTWSTNRITFDNSGNFSAAGNLTVSGIMGLGAGPAANVGLYNFSTSTAGVNGATLAAYDGNPTLATGNYTGLSAANMFLTTMTKTGTGTVDNAAQLWIANAPTIGTNNFAIYSAAGINYFAGNVGIGTTTPGEKLVVYNSAAADSYVTVQSSGTTHDAAFKSYDGTNIAAFGIMPNSGGATGAWSVYNGGIRMTIDNGGNVGIGTTTPGAKLQVLGSGIFGNASNDAVLDVYNNSTGYFRILRYDASPAWVYYLKIKPQAASGNYVGWDFVTNDYSAPGDGSVTTMTLKSGNVGIGTTVPGSKLDIVGNIGTRGAGTYINFDYVGADSAIVGLAAGTNWHLTGSVVGDLAVKAASGQNLLLGTGTTAGIVINAGNVGIGTTTPLEILHIIGNFRASSLAGSGNRCVYADSNGTIHVKAEDCGTSSGGDNLGNHIMTQNLQTGGYWISNDGDNEGIFVGATGNVGIGTTTPAYKFQVMGPIYAFGNGSNTPMDYNNMDLFGRAGYWGFRSDTSLNFNLDVLNGGSPKVAMTILQNGNVGIGTTTPGSTLEVRSGSAPTYGTAKVYSTDYGGYLGSTAGTNGGYLYLTPQNGIVDILNGTNPASIWMYSGSAYTASISSNGVSYFNGGNVGIGTTTPGAALDVQAAQGKVKITSTTGTNATFLQFTNTGGTASFGRESSAGGGLLTGDAPCATVLTGGGNTYPMQFGVNDAVVMTLLNGGNVGIGLTNPGVRLDVQQVADNAAGFYLRSTDGYAYIIAGDDASKNGYLRVRGASGADVVSISSFTSSYFNGGNVGIGTTTPGQKLDVIGAVQSSNNGQFRIRTDAADTSDWVFSSLLPGGAADNNLHIGNFTTARGTWQEYLSILSGGNVGIGTTTPGSKLDVNGDIALGSGGSLFTTGAAGATLTFYGSRSDSGASKMLVLKDGSVGIGIAAPVTKLQIEQGALYANAVQSDTIFNGTPSGNTSGNLIGSDGYWAIRTATNNSYNLDVYNGGSPLAAMTVLQSGNVGIGTTTPGANLHINNTAALSSSGQEVLRLAADYNWLTPGSGPKLTFYYGAGAQETGYIKSVARANSTMDIELGTGYSTLTTKMTITEGGNVGIGTTTPGSLLHVYKNQNASTYIKVENPDSTETAAIAGFQSQADVAAAYLLAHGSARTGTRYGITLGGYGEVLSSSGNGLLMGTGAAITPIIFGTNNLERMRIDSGGNVGIGTTTPGARLVVKGGNTNDLIVDNDGSQYTEIDLANNGTIKANYYWDQTNSNLVINTAGKTILGMGGNVGIGTTSPLEKIHIIGYAKTSSGFVTGDATANSSGGLVNADDTSKSIRIGADLGAAGANSYISFTVDGSSEVARMIAGGNVGIGTTSPGAKLVVDSSATATDATLLNLNNSGLNSINQSTNLTLTTGATGTGYLRVNSSGGTQTVGSISDMILMNHYTALAGYGKLLFGTQDAIRMAIDAGGNVGIGTTTPGASLDVVGSALIRGTYPWLGLYSTAWSGTSYLQNNLTANAAGTGDYMGFLNPAGKGFIFYNSTVATMMTISPGGNVGIGTTSPGAKLEVRGAISTYMGTGGGAGQSLLNDSDNGAMRIYSPTGGSPNNQMYEFYNNRTALLIGYANINRDAETHASFTNILTIQNNGNVGIGTTSPGALLDLSGGATKIKLERSGYDTWDIMQSDPTGTLKGFGIYNNNDTAYRLFIDEVNGNVGIGTTSPGYALTVSGQGSFTNYLYVAGLRLKGTDGGVNQIWQSNAGYVLGITGNDSGLSLGGATNRQDLFINAGGNVGIGTTTPGAPLHVAGVSGAYTARVIGAGTAGNNYGVYIDAGLNSSDAGLRVDTAVDYSFVVRGDGPIRVGAYGAGTLTTDASGNVTASSDERLKNVTGSFDRGISAIMGLKPISYYWKASSGLDTKNKYSGFSAQNVRDFIPEAIDTDPRGYLTLSDRPILAAAVNAIQEQQSLIAQNSQRITQLDLNITGVAQSTEELQAAINDKLNIVSNSLASLNTSVTSFGLRVTETESRLTSAETKLKEDEKNLAVFQSSTNDTLSTMLETESMLTEKILNYEDRIKSLEDKMAVLTVSGGEIPANVITADKSGNVDLTGILTAKGIVAGSVDTKKIKLGDQASGKETLASGKTEKVISTTEASAAAKIYVTPLGKLSGRSLYVDMSKVKDGESFTVELDGDPLTVDLDFNWLVVK